MRVEVAVVMLTSVGSDDEVNALVSMGSVLISIGNIPVIDYCTR
jgi:hypothetical protein